MTPIILCLFCFFLVSAYKPRWGLYLVLFLLPSYQIRFSVLGIPTTFLEWLIIILLFSALLNIKRERLRPRLKIISASLRFPIFFILLFLAAGVISAYVSPATVKALGIFKAYIFEGVVFWFLCLLLIDSKEKLLNCFLYLGGLVTYLSLFGIFQYFTLYNLPPPWWGPGIEPRRAVSFFSYPNAAALLVAPIIALLLALVFRRQNGLNKQANRFLVFSVLSGTLLTFLTFSRGAWIGIAAAIFFLLLASQYKKIFLFLAACSMILTALIPAAKNRLMPVLSGSDPAGLERIKLWKAAAAIIKTQPFFGTGLAGFRDWYAAYRVSLGNEILNYPHNIFLNFWLETGLPGLVSILVLLAWTFKEGMRIYRSQKDLQEFVLAGLAAWIVVLVHGLFDVPFFKNDLAILFWFLLAIVPVLKLLGKNQIVTSL